MNALIGWNPRAKGVDSNPTPRAIIVDSHNGFISPANDKGNVKDLQDAANIQI